MRMSIFTMDETCLLNSNTTRKKKRSIPIALNTILVVNFTSNVIPG